MYKSLKQKINSNISSGIKIALSLIPETLAVTVIIGINPIIGLYTAIIMGLISFLFNSKFGIINNTTSILAIIMLELINNTSAQHLFLTIALMGMLQILASAFNLTKLIKNLLYKNLSYNMTIGAIQGLTMVIIISLVTHFKSNNIDWLSGIPLYNMIGLILLTMAIIKFFPKINKTIPSTIVAIIATSVIVYLFDLNTRVIGDITKASLILPTFEIPSISMHSDDLPKIIYYASFLALISLIELLLVSNFLEESTNKEGSYQKESFTLGVSNLVSGLFGGLAGTALIQESMIDKDFKDSRTSSLVESIFLILFILIGSNLINMIPIASLAGVIFMIIINNFCRSRFYQLSHTSDNIIDSGEKVYKIKGPIFFPSINKFFNFFDVSGDPERVIIDLEKARVLDSYAQNAIKQLKNKYNELNKNLIIINLP